MENIRNDAGGEKLGGHGQNLIAVIKSTCFGVHIARGYEIGKCVDDKWKAPLRRITAHLRYGTAENKTENQHNDTRYGE